MLKSRMSAWSLVVGVAVSAASAGVDSPKTKESGGAEKAAAARQEVEGFWQVDSILDKAVKNIALRYNLNDEQTRRTAEMMNTRVKRFLDEHQDEIWPLIRDLAMYQRKGAAPDAQAARRLGPLASKILKEAEEEIFRSNEEWGEWLTAEQRRVHEYDLREMKKTFRAMGSNFEQWEAGRVASRSVFPQPKPLVDEPPTPPKPPAGVLPSRKSKEESGPMLVNHFEAYVQKFIADYQLTGTQREAVRSILREIVERTDAFRDSHKKDLQAIKTKLAKAADQADRRRLTAELRRLTKPLDDLFAEFKTRLDQIPDQAQRERYASKANSGRSLKSAIDGSRGKRRASEKPGDQTGRDKKSENN